MEGGDSPNLPCSVPQSSQTESSGLILQLDIQLNQWIFQVPVKGGRDYITP